MRRGQHHQKHQHRGDLDSRIQPVEGARTPAPLIQCEVMHAGPYRFRPISTQTPPTSARPTSPAPACAGHPAPSHEAS